MKIINSIAVVVSIFSLTACQTAEQLPIPERVQVQDLRDDDGDGVANARDICADSPVDSLIDNKGCAHWGVEEQREDFVFEFDYDKEVIRQNDLALFPQIISVLEAYPDASILIVGDTSNEGTDDYNQALGLRRADVVMDKLKQYGVDESTIIEFVYSDKSLINIIKKRKRRTIVRVVYYVKEYEPKWDIYTVENQRNEK
ncbi:MAG: outer membrane protein OmpA-like peptidoglycan-associated protein [Porticoccus sp.]|jgi:outer membrane protein OmpA-like peptidoglycan-associated protein